MTVTVAPVGRMQMDLLVAQRAQFEEDGVLVIRDAVSPEAIARVAEASDRIVAEGGSQGRWIGKPVSAKRRVEYRGLFSLDDAFLELLAPPKVFPLMVALLSPNIHVMSSQLLYAHPEPGAARPPRGLAPRRDRLQRGPRLRPDAAARDSRRLLPQRRERGGQRRDAVRSRAATG